MMKKLLCVTLLAMVLLAGIATTASAAQGPYEDYLAFIKDVVSVEGTLKGSGFVALVREVKGEEAASNVRKTLAAQDEPGGEIRAIPNGGIIVDYVDLRTYQGFGDRPNTWVNNLLAGDIIYHSASDTHYMNAYGGIVASWEDWQANHLASAVVMPDVVPVYQKGTDVIPAASFYRDNGVDFIMTPGGQGVSLSLLYYITVN